MNKVCTANLDDWQEAQDEQSDKLLFLWDQTNSNLLIPIRMNLYLAVPGTSFFLLFDIGCFPSSMEQRE